MRKHTAGCTGEQPNSQKKAEQARTAVVGNHFGAGGNDRNHDPATELIAVLHGHDQRVVEEKQKRLLLLADLDVDRRNRADTKKSDIPWRMSATGQKGILHNENNTIPATRLQNGLVFFSKTHEFAVQFQNPITIFAIANALLKGCCGQVQL
jgi:hypothetical protein